MGLPKEHPMTTTFVGLSAIIGQSMNIDPWNSDELLFKGN